MKPAVLRLLMLAVIVWFASLVVLRFVHFLNITQVGTNGWTIDIIILLGDNRFKESPLVSTRMATKKPRIVIYLDMDKDEFLREWAARERRTLNNLVTIIVEDAVVAEKIRLEAAQKDKTS